LVNYFEQSNLFH